MPLFKLVITFLAVGGSSYALFHLQKIPDWMKIVVVIFAITAAIEAAAHLPKAVDGLKQVFQLLKEEFPTVNPQTQNSESLHGQRDAKSEPLTRNSASSYGQGNDEYKPRDAPEPTLPQEESTLAREGAGIAGAWHGGGVVVFSSGQRLRANCHASYSGGAGSVTMSGTCVTPSGSVSQSARLRQVGANS